MDNQYYSSDEPITIPEKDIFNRQKFAREVASMLDVFKNNESYVIGLYAKWGSGKTSTINLINKELESRKDIICININAWMYNGCASDIEYEIANRIKSSIEGTSKAKRSEIRKIIKQASKFMPETIPVIGIPIPIKESINVILAKTKLKEAITKCLVEDNRKCVVFIDDIDRLQGDSILGLLRMMSNLANYGGVTYILPFDKEYVCKSIEDNLPSKISGQEFIEKIITLPLNLSSIPQDRIDNAFLDGLVDLLNNEGIEMSEDDVTRFRIIYNTYGANTYLKTPRDIKRIINVLKFILPCRKNNANITDLIIMEILRVFDSDFYSMIYKMGPSLLCGDSHSIAKINLSNDIDEKKKYIMKLTLGDELKEGILTQLFPYTKTLLDDHYDQDQNKLRKDKRISSVYYFNIYFAPIDDMYDVDDKKIIELIEDINNQEKDIKDIKSYIGSSNEDIFIKKVADCKDLIKNKVSFCKLLLDLVGDNYELHSLLQLNISEKTFFTIDEILKDSPSILDDYIVLLNYNYECNRFKIIPYMIRQVMLYYFKINENNIHDSVSIEFDKYKNAALDIINYMAKNNVIPWNTTGGECLIYSYWFQFSGKDEISKYVMRHIITADDAIDFISQFLGFWTTGSICRRGDLDLKLVKEIDNFVDISFLYNIISGNKKYKQYKGIKEGDLPSFRSTFQIEDYNNVSKVGNEHTARFREAVAKRFMYYYESK